MPLDAQLIGRYSTKAILSRVKAVYEAAPGRWDCRIEDGLVLYFLRTDAEYGVKRLAGAANFCMTESIPAVIRMRRWSEVEPGIIAQLHDHDLNRARHAAETLSKYGSPRAENALWDRLRSFHQQWGNRESDLSNRQDIPRDAAEAASSQYGLVESLAKAQAWLLSDEQVTKVENLTLGSEREI